jgi:16S rRNA processing protein RimM
VELVVGRIARAHGIGGQVAVDVHTDAVDERFGPGCVLATDPADRGPLTVRSARWHSGRLLVAFEGVEDRTGAEGLRGTVLVADSATSPPADADEWWDHDLIGLLVVTPAGDVVGRVSDVAHPTGNDLLVVAREGGGDLFVPFVAAIVPEVDVAGGRLVVDPPEGLLDL